MAKIVANVYGDALFSIALEKGTLESMYKEVLFVKETFAANADLCQFICHPKVSSEEKEAALSGIFAGQVSNDMLGMLMIVLKKSRQDQMDEIFDYFVSAYKEYKGIGIVYVSTPYELSDIQKRQMEEKLLSTTKYHSLEMNYTIDESLIGGAVIRIKDRVVDSSVKNKIEKLTRDLRKIQLGE